MPRLQFIPLPSGTVINVLKVTLSFPPNCSGDNKTEKAARSAQVALIDNGDMTDTLGFIEGKTLKIHNTIHKIQCIKYKHGIQFIK